MPQGGTSKWNVGVRQYPVFAEYAERAETDGRSGISRTGLTMRAFLPIDSQGNRSSVHRYEGLATVADVSVVCFRPNISINGSELVEYDNRSQSGSLKINGTVSIPSELDKEARALGLVPVPFQNFSCSTSHITPEANRKYHPLDWDMSVCQLGSTGGYLTSAWAPSNETRYQSFSSYLLVNLTRAPKPTTAGASHVEFTKLQRVFNEFLPGLAHQDRDDWTDIYQTTNNMTRANGTLSFSLCYPASETRYMDIVASSRAPPVQPRYSYDSENKRVRFDDVRKQMLSSNTTTVEQRGILALQPQHWKSNSGQIAPYLGELDMRAALDVDPYEKNTTAKLLQHYDHPGGRADISIGGLMLEILREGGTTADAVQSMMTALLASRYQDYVFLGDDSATVNASRADFVTVQIPGGMVRNANGAAGATRSYILVMTAIIVHVLTVSFVVVWFCKGKGMQPSFPTPLTRTATHATYLLESWSSISQVYSEMTVPYFKRAAFARDWEVETWMEHKRLHREAIVIERSSAVQRAPSIAGSVKAKKGFFMVEETKFGQDMTCEIRSSQASEMEMASWNERERRSSVSSCSAVSNDS